MPKEPPKVITPEMHSAGTTVLHRSPFESLEVRVDPTPIPSEFIDSWNVPFHNRTLQGVSALEEPLRSRFKEIDVLLIRRLLAYANWRPRSVGAAFATLRMDTEITDDLGRLLLRSDVCYSGAIYCFALARFNTERSIGYLREYLEYYLTRADLWYDQAEAMAALHYADARNGTAYARSLLESWHRFVANKPEWNLERSCTRFAEEMKRIDAAAARLRAAGA
jgi:hypothetical protein